MERNRLVHELSASARTGPRGEFHPHHRQSRPDNIVPAPVAIIMGSQSDWTTMRHAAETLDALGIAVEALIVSAHRTPERLYAFARGAKAAGHKVIIAGAGGAAHLPGMTAALTDLPVFGVPMESKALSGVDSLSHVQMRPESRSDVAIGKRAPSMRRCGAPAGLSTRRWRTDCRVGRQQSEGWPTAGGRARDNHQQVSLAPGDTSVSRRQASSGACRAGGGGGSASSVGVIARPGFTGFDVVQNATAPNTPMSSRWNCSPPMSMSSLTSSRPCRRDDMCLARGGGSADTRVLEHA